MIAALNGLSLLARVGIAAGLVAVLVGSCALRDASLRKEGAARVIATAKEQGKANAERSRKAHEKAREPGAADRLLRDSCRDC